MYLISTNECILPVCDKFITRTKVKDRKSRRLQFCGTVHYKIVSLVLLCGKRQLIITISPGRTWWWVWWCGCCSTSCLSSCTRTSSSCRRSGVARGVHGRTRRHVSPPYCRRSVDWWKVACRDLPASLMLPQVNTIDTCSTLLWFSFSFISYIFSQSWQMNS